MNLKLFESSNYSPKFIDLMRECLMFDPKDRMKPFDLLSHPVFCKYNKIYISQQIVMTRPVTKVEKHHLKKLRLEYKNLTQPAEEIIMSEQDQVDQEESTDIKFSHLLDIIKLKVNYEKNMSFLHFLTFSFNQIAQQRETEFQNTKLDSGKLKGFNSSLIKQAMANQHGQQMLKDSKFTKKKRIPTLVRIINKEENQFSSTFKYGSNLRFLREQNFKPELEMETGSFDEDQ